MNELTLGADPIGGTSSLLNKLSRGLMVILVAYAAFIVVWDQFSIHQVGKKVHDLVKRSG